MAARSVPNSAQGLYVAAWGGHNAQSHNHNDVGNFIVYGDGKPVLIDVGVETYSAKTFSPQRYEIWTMQSAYQTCRPSTASCREPDGSSRRRTCPSTKRRTGSPFRPTSPPPTQPRRRCGAGSGASPSTAKRPWWSWRTATS